MDSFTTISSESTPLLECLIGSSPALHSAELTCVPLFHSNYATKPIHGGIDMPEDVNKGSGVGVVML